MLNIITPLSDKMLLAGRCSNLNIGPIIIKTIEKESTICDIFPISFLSNEILSIVKDIANPKIKRVMPTLRTVPDPGKAFAFKKKPTDIRTINKTPIM